MPRKHPPSTPKPATDAPCPPLPLTVQSALDWTATWTDLTPTKLGNIRSSLGRVAGMVGMPPGAVVLTPETLRTILFEGSAASYGLSDSRMRNIRTDLRTVLRRADVVDTVDTVPSGQWETLLARLDIRKRAEVIGFARFCTSREIEPDAVCTETLASFEEQLTARTLIPRVSKRVGSLRSFWNLACRKVLGWPQHRLEGGRTHDYVRPVGDFPESFQCDLIAFGDRLTATVLDDPFDDDVEPVEEDAPEASNNGFKPVRDTTGKLRQSHARWAASALVATGVPIADVISLADLVRPSSRAQAILRFLYRRAGSEPSPAGMHVAEVLSMVAKHHAQLNKEERLKTIRDIKKWAKPVHLEYRGMTEKNAASVREASIPSRDAKLLFLAEALMEDARSLLLTSPHQAVSLALRAVAIEILTKTPLRLGELIGLRLDQHLKRPDPKRRRISHIEIPREERKNEEDLSVEVSKETSALFNEWVTVFRSISASPDCVYLFPGHGTGNRPITPQGMRDAIKDVTGKRVGVKLSPHVFRHLAAYHVLEVRPGQYGLVQRLLGHKSILTTQRHYAGREGKAAHKMYDALVLNRKALHKPKPGKGPVA